jgi:outer membrane protein assembly factor BamD (BamD/ComL family)
LDIPLVPNELIAPDDARSFALRTDTVARLPKVPIEGACEVTSKLEDYRIQFDTTCPGRPHIVKVSYFPRWTAGDTGRVVPVSPGFMLVYPNGPHVELTYVRTALDRTGVALTLLGLGFIVVSLAWPRPRELVVAGVSRLVGPLARALERRRTLASVVLAVAMIAAGAGTRLSLREPDREYQEAQEAYRNRDFESAIRLLEEWTAEDRDTFKQATALHQLGVSYNEVGQYASAVQVLERLRFEFPNVDYGAATLFHLAKSWLALGAADRAREYASMLQINFADSGLNQRLRKEAPSLFSEG